MAKSSTLASLSADVRVEVTWYLFVDLPVPALLRPAKTDIFLLKMFSTLRTDLMSREKHGKMIRTSLALAERRCPAIPSLGKRVCVSAMSSYQPARYPKSTLGARPFSRIWDASFPLQWAGCYKYNLSPVCEVHSFLNFCASQFSPWI